MNEVRCYVEPCGSRFSALEVSFVFPVGTRETGIGGVLIICVICFACRLCTIYRIRALCV